MKNRESDKNRMLAAFAKLGQATSREAGTYCFGKPIVRRETFYDSLRRRSEELVKDGLLRVAGRRKCLESNRTATFYEVASNEKNLLPGFSEACQEPSN